MLKKIFILFCTVFTIAVCSCQGGTPDASNSQSTVKSLYTSVNSLAFTSSFIKKVDCKSATPYDITCMLVVANADMYANTELQGKIDRYISDINNAYGCSVLLYTAQHGNPANLKNLISSVYASDKINGAVLIGDLPKAFFEIYNSSEDNYDRFLCDIYFMDLDGEWQDNANGQYGAQKVYTNSGISGFQYSQTDATINFAWGSGSPSNINNDRFSIHWEGYIKPAASDYYTFYMDSDNGCRLRVNDNLLIGKWNNTYSANGAPYSSRKVYLEKDVYYPVSIDYQEQDGAAFVSLKWAQGSSTTPVVIPTECLKTPDKETNGLLGYYFNNPELLENDSNVYEANVSNGVFDTHPIDEWDASSSISPEIFVSRIDATAMGLCGDEYALTSQFFDKDHRYWNGNVYVTNRSVLVKQGEPGAGSGYKFKSALEKVFGSERVRYNVCTKDEYLDSELSNTDYTAKINVGHGGDDYHAIECAKAGGLTAVYYNGTALDNNGTLKPVLERTDATIDFNWGDGSPGSAVNADYFSARWTGYIKPTESGTYTFEATPDNGFRLYVNGQTLVDQWIDDWDVTYQGSIYLEAGKYYPIQVDYFEAYGGASIALKWKNSSESTCYTVPSSVLYTTYQEGIEIKDVITRSPQEIFHHFCSCNPMRSQNRDDGPRNSTISGAYLFNPNDGARTIAVAGSSKTSGGDQLDLFLYESAGDYNPIGAAFKDWVARRMGEQIDNIDYAQNTTYNYNAAGTAYKQTVSADLIGWFYGEMICGDPLVMLQKIPHYYDAVPSHYFSMDTWNNTNEYALIWSINYPDDFVNFDTYQTRISELYDDTHLAHSAFRINAGLADASAVSIESVLHPGYYLTCYNTRILLLKNDNSSDFAKAATFYKRSGLSDSSCTSFESYKFPGNYIRHRNWYLYLSSKYYIANKEDATFIIVQ